MLDAGLNIFDKKGKIRNLDEDADTIAALPDDHRAKLFACIEAVTQCEAGQERIRVARDTVRKLETAEDQSQGAHGPTPATADRAGAEKQVSAARAAGIATTKRIEAARAVSAAQQPGYKPEPAAKPKPNKVEKQLAEARVELQQSTREQRALEIAAGESINAWRACLPVITRDDLMKDHVARGQAERAARVARGESPEPKRVEPPYQSELDRVKGQGPRAKRSF